MRPPPGRRPKLPRRLAGPRAAARSRGSTGGAPRRASAGRKRRHAPDQSGCRTRRRRATGRGVRPVRHPPAASSRGGTGRFRCRPAKPSPRMRATAGAVSRLANRAMRAERSSGARCRHTDSADARGANPHAEQVSGTIWCGPYHVPCLTGSLGRPDPPSPTVPASSATTGCPREMCQASIRTKCPTHGSPFESRHLRRCLQASAFFTGPVRTQPGASDRGVPARVG